MMNASKIFIHSQNALPKENANLIKEGSSVLVRVLKQTGSNSYIASFAGGRFTVSSRELLKPGSTFMARVSFADGKLNLSKIPSEQNAAQNTDAKNVVTSSNTLTSEVASLLQSLGITPDSVSKTLLQTFIASGSKVNFEKLNKARAQASKFEGREDEAAEAALILLEKGIEPTFENISDVLTGFSLEKNSVHENSDDEERFDEKEIEKELKRFFSSLEKFDRDAGFLTVFNHLAAKNTDNGAGHFAVVPFEFEFEKGEKHLSGDGVFRVIFDILKKSVKKAVINIKLNGAIWNFVIFLEKGHIKKVKLCQYSELSIETDKSLCSRLSDFLGGIPVEAESFEKLSGFASGEILINVVKGLA